MLTLPPKVEEGLVDYFKKRLGYNDEQYEAIMNGPRKNYRDFKTYKRNLTKKGFKMYDQTYPKD